MTCKMLSIVWIFLGLALEGVCFRPPDFQSSWLSISAQSGTLSVLDVEHGLGAVPDLVEVLVKAVDGQNEDFIFKAMGHAGKDDDFNHVYGGVIYLYNEQFVKIVVPNRNNQHVTGGAIYTGESQYWTGVNEQFSLDAAVQIRCWTRQSLPSACFHRTGVEIESGKEAGSRSYIEVDHNLMRYPEVVKVRAYLTGDDLEGWYCDAQGSVSGHFANTHLQGGMHFGYSDSSVTVWASNQKNAILCGYGDGWGDQHLESKTGVVEVMAWCNLGLRVTYERSISLDSSIDTTDLDIQLPQTLSPIDNVLLSFLVRVESGSNEGFLFEGIGSAKSSVYNINTSPCVYGGVIYAYSETSIRMWIPNTEYDGAAVCISEGYGQGQNAQGANDVTIIITARQWDVLREATVSEPLSSFYCGHFYRVGEDLAYNALSLKQDYRLSPGECWKMCHRDALCSTFTFANNLCKTYQLFQREQISSETGSELWTVEL